MTSPSAKRKPRGSANPSRGSRRSTPKKKTPPEASGGTAASTGSALLAPEPNSEPRTTKQELVLTLLSRSGGASIDEIMQATDWQAHSARGFLSGTVKKKLGFALTSSKADDGTRRYRITTRRGS